MKKLPCLLLFAVAAGLASILTLARAAVTFPLYVSDPDSTTIVQITSNSVGSVFASTGLSEPAGLTFDRAGNLYVANYGSSRIEKFSPNGVDLGVFASTGLNGPEGLAFDSEGNLYVANVNNHQIVRFTPDGFPSLFNFANLSGPAFIAFAPVPPFAFRITAVEKLGNDLQLSFTSQSGTNYAVQSRADLSSGTWMTLPDTTNFGTGGIMQQTLTNAFSQPQQFYRVQQW